MKAPGQWNKLHKPRQPTPPPSPTDPKMGDETFPTLKSSMDDKKKTKKTKTADDKTAEKRKKTMPISISSSEEEDDCENSKKKKSLTRKRVIRKYEESQIHTNDGDYTSSMMKIINRIKERKERNLETLYHLIYHTENEYKRLEDHNRIPMDRDGKNYTAVQKTIIKHLREKFEFEDVEKLMKIISPLQAYNLLDMRGIGWKCAIPMLEGDISNRRLMRENDENKPKEIHLLQSEYTLFLREQKKKEKENKKNKDEDEDGEENIENGKDECEKMEVSEDGGVKQIGAPHTDPHNDEEDEVSSRRKNYLGVLQRRVPVRIHLGGKYYIQYGGKLLPGSSKRPNYETFSLMKEIDTRNVTEATMKRCLNATLCISILDKTLGVIKRIHQEIEKCDQQRDDNQSICTFIKSRDDDIKWMYTPVERMWKVDLSSRLASSCPSLREDLDSMNSISSGNVVTKTFSYDAITFHRISQTKPFTLSIPIRYIGNLQMALEYLFLHLPANIRENVVKDDDDNDDDDDDDDDDEKKVKNKKNVAKDDKKKNKKKC